MNIMHFLTPKALVEYIYFESTVRQGLEKMRYHGFSAIPVIDKDGHYKGTVTEGDFLWALYNDQKPDLKKLETTPIASIIHKKYTAVNAGADMNQILSTATQQNFVPVVDDRNVFIGIITRKAIMQHLAAVQTVLD
jgi:CBS domain-containing protein